MADLQWMSANKAGGLDWKRKCVCVLSFTCHGNNATSYSDVMSSLWRNSLTFFRLEQKEQRKRNKETKEWQKERSDYFRNPYCYNVRTAEGVNLTFRATLTLLCWKGGGGIGSRFLGRIIGRTKNEITAGWRNCVMYSTADNAGMIKSR